MKLTTNTPFKHDGKTLKAGESFDAGSKEEAEALIEQGVARKSGDPEPEASGVGQAVAPEVPTTPGEADTFVPQATTLPQTPTEGVATAEKKPKH